MVKSGKSNFPALPEIYILIYVYYTWMVNECPLPVGLLDLVLICALAYAEDLVVVLPFALLELQLGVLEEPPVLPVGLVHSVRLLVVPHSLLIILQLHVGLGAPQQGLHVSVIQLKGCRAVRNGLFQFVQLKI